MGCFYLCTREHYGVRLKQDGEGKGCLTPHYATETQFLADGVSGLHP
jgi:hypothetical protein